MKGSGRWITAALLMAAAVTVQGCSGDDKTTVVVQQQPAANQRSPLSPLRLQQFGNAFVEIPIAPKDATTPTTYNVTIRQGTWDFGLRNVDGSQIMDAANGKPIVTKTWGYDINGVFLGAYGATVEATKGTALTFNYFNELRDEVNGVKGTGPYLTKHLLQIDPTIDGTSLGEPECRIVTHLHGGDVATESDGHPEAWVANDPAVQAKWALPADPIRGTPRLRPPTGLIRTPIPITRRHVVSGSMITPWGSPG